MKLSSSTFVTIWLILFLALASFIGYDLWRRAPLPEGLIQVSGRIEGDPVTIVAPFPGRIKQLMAKENDFVQNGQVLCVIDDSKLGLLANQAQQSVDSLMARRGALFYDLEVHKRDIPITIDGIRAEIVSIRAGLVTGRAQEKQKQKDAERFRHLVKIGAVNRRAGEEAELALTKARQELAAKRADLTGAMKRLTSAHLGWDRLRANQEELRLLDSQLTEARAELAEARKILADPTVKAPTSGLVISRRADVGDSVEVDAPILEVVDLDHLYLRAQANEAQIGRMNVGLASRVYVEPLGRRMFRGTLGFIAPPVAPLNPEPAQSTNKTATLAPTRGLKVFIEANPERVMRPGMPAVGVVRWNERVDWVRPRN